MRSGIVMGVGEEKKMKKEKGDKFAKELAELCNKHGLKNCVFSGESETDKMIGLFSVEKMGQRVTTRDILESGLNAARLYQASREKIFYVMDKEARG